MTRERITDIPQTDDAPAASVVIRKRRLSILNHIPEAYVEIDSNGVIIEWNSQAESLLGWKGCDALNQKLAALMIAPAERDAFDKVLARFGSEVEAVSCRGRSLETTALRQDGSEFAAELLVFRMQEEQGACLAAFVRDIRENVEIEQEAENRHRTIMDQLGEAYNESDFSGNYTYLSKQYYDIYNPSYSEGQNVEWVLSAELRRFLDDMFREIYRTGRPARTEYDLYDSYLYLSRKYHDHPDPAIREALPAEYRNFLQEIFSRAASGGDLGSIEYLNQYDNERLCLYVELSAALRRNPRGRAVGFMNLSHDCTPRKRAEIKLAQAREAADAASQATSEFLANMNHEIRTPLNGVLGALELLDGTRVTAEQKELLEMARISAGSLLALIDDVLDFSKIEAGKLEFHRVAFDLREAVAQAVGAIAISATHKGLKLNVQTAADMPRLWIGDPLRLKQVLINLLGNAIKFTEHGEIAVQVDCQELKDRTAKLRFGVSDTGIGIPADQQQLIFEAFSQAEASTARKFGGTGLGLAICGRIVRYMGGRIWVESARGRGSTFYFTASLEIAEVEDSIAEKPRILNSGQEGRACRKILLVEDNAINQKVVVALLERFGHEVTVANNGKEALAKFAETVFDLILMDIQMPEMDGFAAAAAIRSQESGGKSHVPIVALTAHAMKEDRERCLEAGMDDYVAKPINAVQLRETIERAALTRAK